MNLQLLLDNIPHLLLFCVLIGVNGLIAGSETALFSLDRQQVNQLRASNEWLARLIISLRERPSTLLSTILLSNIAVNVLLYSVLVVSVNNLAAGEPLRMTILGGAGFILIFLGAEIIPKLAAFALCRPFAMIAALPIRVLEIVTFPVRWVLVTVLVEPLTRVISGPPRRAGVQSEELQQMLNICRSEGLIDPRETDMLHAVMELRRTRVRSVMIPRVDVIAAERGCPREELIRTAVRNRLLRIPIHEGGIDRIIGQVSTRDLLLYPEAPLDRLLLRADFIPEQATVEALLQHFHRTRTQLALVVDEYGGLAGIVALEDVAEAVVGDLQSAEEAGSVSGLRRIDERSFLVNAAMNLEDFRRAFNLPIEENRVDTVGGYVGAELDRLPEVGDQIAVGRSVLTVVVMRGRRVLRLRYETPDPIEATSDLERLLDETRAAASGAPTVAPGGAR